MEITNSVIKWVYSLSQKKNRMKERCFVAEGTKCVLDTAGFFRIRYLFASAVWIERHGRNLAVVPIMASETQLERMSMLKTAPEVIAVYEMPEWDICKGQLATELSLVLDGVQGPGNLGTIVRIADWFGIRTVLCSEDTVDVYNPKTVQATMGAIARVRVSYCNLASLFEDCQGIPVYGTFLDGSSIYDAELGGTGFIVMGNEGKGISPDLEKYMTKRLLIPSYPQGVPTSESLNVGMAAAIIAGEFRRRML